MSCRSNNGSWSRADQSVHTYRMGAGSGPNLEGAEATPFSLCHRAHGGLPPATCCPGSFIHPRHRQCNRRITASASLRTVCPKVSGFQSLHRTFVPFDWRSRFSACKWQVVFYSLPVSAPRGCKSYAASLGVCHGHLRNRRSTSSLSCPTKEVFIDIQLDVHTYLRMYSYIERHSGDIVT